MNFIYVYALDVYDVAWQLYLDTCRYPIVFLEATEHRNCTRYIGFVGRLGSQQSPRNYLLSFPYPWGGSTGAVRPSKFLF